MTLSRHWTTYVFYVYLAVLVWTPLPLSSGPAWASAFFNILVASTSLAVFIGCWRTGHALPPAFQLARWPIMAWAAYCAWLLFQNYAGFSINRFASYQQFLLTLSYLQIFLLTLFLVDSRDRVRILFYALVACGVFQAVYGGLMTMSGEEKIWWLEKQQHRGLATGTFWNRNQLANYLVMCLSAGCGLLVALQKSTPINTWRQLLRRLVSWLLSGSGWLRLLLAVMVIGVVLTHSRMGNVSLFISLTLVGIIWLSRNRSSWKRATLLIGSLLLVDALIVGAWFGIDKVVDRIQETQADNASEWVDEQLAVDDVVNKSVVTENTTADPATAGVPDAPAQSDKTVQAEVSPVQAVVQVDAGEKPASKVTPPSAKLAAPDRPIWKKRTEVNELRDEVFPQLVQMARANLMTGIGLGNFRTGFAEYNLLKIRQVYNEAHCDYLQFLIEVGLPGFVLLGLIVLFCVTCGFVTLWTSQSRLLQGVGFAVSMTAVASLLHAWVEFNFQSVAPTVVFIVMMAVAIVSRSLPDKQVEHGVNINRSRRSAGGFS